MNADPALALPAPVSDALYALLGGTPRVERLGGLSGSVVVRARGPRGSVVVKRTGSAAEPWVYARLAPELHARGVALPALHAALVVDDTAWLLLEDVPQPFPRERWLADHAQLAMLARLHRAPLALLDGMPDRYQPSWDDALSARALALLPHDGAFAARLGEFQRAAAALFEPRALVSGDPNPANWGLRADGALVLFDWERLTRAHPALDLAITLPGLPSRADAELVVARYPAPLDAGLSLEQLLVAKAWTVVELLAGIVEREAPHPPVDGWLRAAFPAWLAGIASR